MKVITIIYSQNNINNNVKAKKESRIIFFKNLIYKIYTIILNYNRFFK